MRPPPRAPRSGGFRAGCAVQTEPGPPLVGLGSDATRRGNLSALLTHVHRSGGQSRSALTQATGLNRSTIGGLVGELVELGLVTESTSERAQGVGRPSPVVRPAEWVAVVAVVPEADAVTVALVGLGGRVLARRRTAFPEPPRADRLPAFVARELAGLRSHLPDVRLLAMGVAVPGLVRSADGLVRLAPHLGWREEPVGALLQSVTDLPVTVSNDATLGARAEAVFGAARGYSDAVYINGGSSGIGGGIIVGGVPLRGVHGYAGEFGHTHVGVDDTRDVAGVPGSLESQVTRSSLSALMGLGQMDHDEFESALVGSRNTAVLAEVDRQLAYLATALGNVLNILNPQLIVLGGFLAALDAARPGRLSALLEDRALDAALEGVEIRRAALGSDLQLIGAAELAFAAFLADPASAARPRGPAAV